MREIDGAREGLEELREEMESVTVEVDVDVMFETCAAIGR